MPGLEADHRMRIEFLMNAALAKLRAGALDHVLAAHVSAEAGHRALLGELKLRPLLDLGMRLGEGSGAALALPILRAAAAVMKDMATFASAEISAGERAADHSG